MRISSELRCLCILCLIQVLSIKKYNNHETFNPFISDYLTY